MFAAIADLLFPPRCAACRELLPPSEQVSVIGELCAVCESTLDPIEESCRRCGMPEDGIPEDGMPGERRGSCASCAADPPAFDGAQSAFLYGAAIADLLHRFKYEDHSELARPLGIAIAALDLPATDLVAPIPLHASRRRARTYDQALYLARVVARRRGVPCEPRLLTRVRSTARQVGQSRAARALNVRGAFIAGPAARGRSVLLIDDVVTTGATAAECARALKAAGARRVFVASVARAT